MIRQKILLCKDDFDRTDKGFSQKRVVRTALDIYVIIFQYIFLEVNLCSFFIVCLYICIAVGDPVIKEEGLGSH